MPHRYSMSLVHEVEGSYEVNKTYQMAIIQTPNLPIKFRYEKPK